MSLFHIGHLPNNWTVGVNGGWSGWYVSGSWSTSCGYGTLPLVRYCNNPSPSCGGSGCPGSGSGYNARSICCRKYFFYICTYLPACVRIYVSASERCILKTMNVSEWIEQRLMEVRRVAHSLMCSLSPLPVYPRQFSWQRWMVWLVLFRFMVSYLRLCYYRNNSFLQQSCAELWRLFMSGILIQQYLT